MSENLARCRRCHDVFDPEAGICPRCGTPWQAISAPPPPEEGTYADRYADTEFALAVEDAPPVTPRAGPSLLLLAGGSAMLLVALIGGLVFASGALSPAPTMPPIIVSLAPKPSPTPTPSIRPEIVMTLSALNDPSLNAHVVIQSVINQDAVISGHPYSAVVTFDGTVSAGEEDATVTSAGKSQEIRFADGQYYVRSIPGTKWVAASRVASWVRILPLFDITTPKMLEFVDDEMREGQETYHFKATRYWIPNLNRLVLTDVSVLGIKPDTVSLDLWTTTFGKPVYASFSGTTLAYDGRKLLDLETTYTFTDVGVPVDVINPFATPTPTSSPTPIP
jgi:hypothetical protein